MSVALDVMSKECSNDVNSMNGRKYDNGDSTDGTRVTGGRNFEVAEIIVNYLKVSML